MAPVLQQLPIPREASFTSRLRSPQVTARVGVWLGICFLTAFVTGWFSHEAQEPDTWLFLPTRPVSLYRVTQGLHIITGTAAIPLLLIKLWTVFPKLFAAPPRAARLVLLEILERGSIGVLVASSIFQVVTGLMNSAQWYPWEFNFKATHYALAWIAIGSLVLHIAVKLPIIRDALGDDIEHGRHDRASMGGKPPISRRGLVRTALLASGVAALATAGSTVPVLRRVSIFGVRSGRGPGGIPINKSAQSAGVIPAALAEDYRLTVAYKNQEMSFSRSDLQQMEQRTHDLPIACVEGWSASGTWTGVRLRDLLDAVGAPRGKDVQVESLQPSGPYRRAFVPRQYADDDLTLLALELEGEPLALDHGYPCRLIAPNRPGVLQTKWVNRVEVLG